MHGIVLLQTTFFSRELTKQALGKRGDNRIKYTYTRVTVIVANNVTNSITYENHNSKITEDPYNKLKTKMHTPSQINTSLLN